MVSSLLFTITVYGLRNNICKKQFNLRIKHHTASLYSFSAWKEQDQGFQWPMENGLLRDVIEFDSF